MRKRCAFTIVELMLAMTIFGMVITGIYAVWSAILKATKAGQTAASTSQRARVAIAAIEDALLTSQMFTANYGYYAFLADTSGDFAEISLVGHLPASFPGVGRYGDHLVRRVSFTVEQSEDKQLNLVMSQGPMLLTATEDFEPYRLVLAKNISLFMLDFWDDRAKEWVAEWTATNQLPRMVRVAIGLGKVGPAGTPQDLVTRVIALPASAVLPEWQIPQGAGSRSAFGITNRPGTTPGDNSRGGRERREQRPDGFQSQPGSRGGVGGNRGGFR